MFSRLSIEEGHLGALYWDGSPEGRRMGRKGEGREARPKVELVEFQAELRSLLSFELTLLDGPASFEWFTTPRSV